MVVLVFSDVPLRDPGIVHARMHARFVRVHEHFLVFLVGNLFPVSILLVVNNLCGATMLEMAFKVSHELLMVKDLRLGCS